MTAVLATHCSWTPYGIPPGCPPDGGSGHGSGVDWSALTAGFGGELGAAVLVALLAVGSFLALLLAYRLVRAVLRA